MGTDAILAAVSIFINLIVVVFQTRIRADLADLKLWAVDRFVSKEDIKICSYPEDNQR